MDIGKPKGRNQESETRNQMFLSPEGFLPGFSFMKNLHVRDKMLNFHTSCLLHFDPRQETMVLGVLRACQNFPSSEYLLYCNHGERIIGRN
jgi:hypothetical protein